MTVKELIEELKKYPENLEVKIADWSEGIEDPKFILEVKQIKEKIWKGIKIDSYIEIG